MKHSRLDEIFEFIRNGASIKQGVEGGFPITRIETISNGFIDKSKMGYAAIFELKKYEEYLLKNGDILMSHINSEKHLGKTAIFKIEEDVIHGMNLLCLRPKKDIVIPEYAYYFFNSIKFKKEIPRITKKSVNQASFTVTDVKTIEIPLPPLETQQKIANALDKAQEIIDIRKKQIKLLDEFLKGVFIHMFGDPVRNTMGWDIVKVSDVCKSIVPGRDKPKRFTGSIPWITINDLLIDGATKQSKLDMGLTEDEILEVKGKIIPTGSVIMSCVGELGITSIAGCDLVMNQQLHSFQCGKSINNIFLKRLLPFQKKYMEKMATSTTVLYMNKTTCNSIPIILPPIELQNKFASIVEATEKQRALMEQSLAEMGTNFNSIMQRAFRGELFN